MLAVKESKFLVEDKDEIFNIVYAPNGKFIVYATANKVIIKEISGKIIKEFFTDNDNICVSNNSELVVYVEKNNTIVIYNISENTFRRLVGNTARVTCIAFIPGLNILLSGSHDKVIREWDIINGSCYKLYKTNDVPIKISFHPTFITTYIISVIGNTAPIMFRGQDDVMHGYIKDHQYEENTAVQYFYTNDGKYLIGHKGNEIRIYESAVGQEIIHTFIIRNCIQAICQIDKYLAISVATGAIIFYSLNYFKWVSDLPSCGDNINCIAAKDNNIILGYQSGAIAWHEIVEKTDLPAEKIIPVPTTGIVLSADPNICLIGKAPEPDKYIIDTNILLAEKKDSPAEQKLELIAGGMKIIITGKFTCNMEQV